MIYDIYIYISDTPKCFVMKNYICLTLHENVDDMSVTELVGKDSIAGVSEVRVYLAHSVKKPPETKMCQGNSYTIVKQKVVQIRTGRARASNRKPVGQRGISPNEPRCKPALSRFVLTVTRCRIKSLMVNPGYADVIK